jgi:hypothetical protein
VHCYFLDELDEVGGFLVFPETTHSHLEDPFEEFVVVVEFLSLRLGLTECRGYLSGSFQCAALEPKVFQCDE